MFKKVKTFEVFGGHKAGIHYSMQSKVMLQFFQRLMDTSFALKFSPSFFKIFIYQVFSANKQHFYNLPHPLDAKEPSTTLVLPYNSLFNQFQRIMKSSLNTKIVFKYHNTIARFLIKNSQAPLEIEKVLTVSPVWNAMINIMERL